MTRATVYPPLRVEKVVKEVSDTLIRFEIDNMTRSIGHGDPVGIA